MTYLAVPIKVVDRNIALVGLSEAVAAGAEVIELRLDYLKDPTEQNVREIVSAARQVGKPIIATCRASWEGGCCKLSELDRQNLLAQAVKAGAELIDIELKCFEQEQFQLDKVKVSSQVKTIISYHDFESKPDEPEQILEEIRIHRPDIAKIVYQAESINDCFACFDMIRQQRQVGKEIIALAMGGAGVITRLLAKKLGAFLSFGSLAEGAESAPGQVTIEEMMSNYSWRDINSQTSLLGVIGNPIAHSLSPMLHNTGFRALGYNGLYLPLMVDTPWNKFREFLDGIRKRPWLGFKGFSVTIPHKQNALNYVKENNGYLEPLAEQIGAVNTLLLDEQGKIFGYNTDYAGALDAITQTMEIERSDLENLKAAVIGAGGVARAVVAGLRNQGAEVTIYNRTVEKAEMLADDFGCQFYGLDELAETDADLLVNCTSMGMHPQVDMSPMPAEYIRPGITVFDTVYNPAITKLLKDAAEAKAKIIDGVTMFVNQAAVQFKMFTGCDAPCDKMRKVIEEKLGQDKNK